MEWIVNNKEWIFSGVGVFIVSVIGAFVFRRVRASTINQTQTSGTRSTNYQSAGDLNVNVTEKNDAEG